MGNKHSCIPKRLKRLKKRRKGLRESREQIQIYNKLQNGLETDHNQDYYSLQAETCSAKEQTEGSRRDGVRNSGPFIKNGCVPGERSKTTMNLVTEQNDRSDIEGTLFLNPIKEWDQSGMELEDLGEIIHCSKVKINWHSCKEVTDRCLVLFQNHLVILSDDFHGFTYQGTLPLAGISVHDVNGASDGSGQSHMFQITGPLVHPFTVYCSTEEEVKEWLYHLDRQREENSKVPAICRGRSLRTSNSNSPGQRNHDTDLRTLVLSQPLYGGERTSISSLGNILWISEAKLQHLPSQEKHDRLLVLFPTTLLILMQVDYSLVYKGELPLNALTISEQDPSDSDSRTLLMEGKMINQIVVSCPSRSVYQSLIHHLSSTGVTVHKYSLVITERDGKHSLQRREQIVKKHKSSPLPACRNSVKAPGRKLHSLSQPSPLSSSVSENLLVTGNRLSFGYAEPFAALKMEAALPEDVLSHGQTVSTQDPLTNWEQSTNRRSGSNNSRPSPVTTQPGSTGVNHCLSNGGCLNNPLSPTYAEPYLPLRLQPAPPAKAVWLREPLSRHSSSPLPAHEGDQRASLWKTPALSRQPGSYNACFREDRYSPTVGPMDTPLSPAYAEPFGGIMRDSPSIRGSAAEPVFKQKDSSDADHWSIMVPSTEGRFSLSSPSVSENSSCAYMDGKPLSDILSPTYAEPYNSFQFPLDCHRVRDGVPRKGSTDFPVHFSKDDNSEYFAIMEVLDSYREEKAMSWYSDDTRFSITSSEPTYAELESPQADTDDGFWDFKQQLMPHLSPATLRKVCQRGMVDSRLQGVLHRWS
ncbi:probable pleckstrin homology domain-containing family N member 1 isoform X2 [Mobula hypostoma]|uniref:probable pleckstrin homology domain-containing family N member 1 isoform X2 n=1 Tax=Mobula hypostoma TaxID=723540 RepID=UPI002FC3D5FE